MLAKAQRGKPATIACGTTLRGASARHFHKGTYKRRRGVPETTCCFAQMASLAWWMTGRSKSCSRGTVRISKGPAKSSLRPPTRKEVRTTSASWLHVRSNMPQVIIQRGGSFHSDYVFSGSDYLMIGRAQSNDICLPDPARRVSRYHAAIIRADPEG